MNIYSSIPLTDWLNDSLNCNLCLQWRHETHFYFVFNFIWTHSETNNTASLPLRRVAPHPFTTTETSSRVIVLILQQVVEPVAVASATVMKFVREQGCTCGNFKLWLPILINRPFSPHSPIHRILAYEYWHIITRFIYMQRMLFLQSSLEHTTEELAEQSQAVSPPQLDIMMRWSVRVYTLDPSDCQYSE